MVPFGGWDMPVQYQGGIISEVRAVRNSSGMFDVSHMGRVVFSGPGAEAFLGTVLGVDMPGLGEGRSKYHVICNEQGGIIDDAIVYRLPAALPVLTGAKRLPAQRFLLVINAGNADVDLAWLLPRAQRHGGVTVDVMSDRVAMVAVQGPKAIEIVDRLSGSAAGQVRRFGIGGATIAGVVCWLARTGYTGEDGFEVMLPAAQVPELWARLASEGVAMCGLGARDVLRLEAGLLLHGNDMTVENNPVEADLERFLYLDGPGYVAGPALKRIEERGTPRVLVGIRMVQPGIPRHGMTIVERPLLAAGEATGDGGARARVPVIGVVTSGTHSPTLDAAIGMGYVDRRFSATGTRIGIAVRGKLVEAEVVTMPFYSRKR
jgi:aminomethyltransferase